MKKLISIVIIVFFPLLAIAQNEVYHIIKVEGDITNLTTGKAVAAGDQIKPTDRLEFKNTYAKAIAISSTRGKFTLSMPEKQEDLFSNNRLLAMADNAASPIEGRTQLSTRAIGMTDIKDLKVYLGSPSFYIIGDKVTLRLSKNTYPLNENNFIILSYQGKREQVAKKLGYSGQMLDIEKSQIVADTEDFDKGNTLNNVLISKYDNIKKKSTLVTTVNFVFLDPDQVKQEFDLIVPLLKQDKKSRYEAVEYLKGYFNDVYGNTDQDALYLLINMTLRDYSL